MKTSKHLLSFLVLLSLVTNPALSQELLTSTTIPYAQKAAGNPVRLSQVVQIRETHVARIIANGKFILVSIDKDLKINKEVEKSMEMSMDANLVVLDDKLFYLYRKVLNKEKLGKIQCQELDPVTLQNKGAEKTLATIDHKKYYKKPYFSLDHSIDNKELIVSKMIRDGKVVDRTIYYYNSELKQTKKAQHQGAYSSDFLMLGIPGTALTKAHLNLSNGKIFQISNSISKGALLEFDVKTQLTNPKKHAINTKKKSLSKFKLFHSGNSIIISAYYSLKADMSSKDVAGIYQATFDLSSQKIISESYTPIPKSIFAIVSSKKENASTLYRYKDIQRIVRPEGGLVYSLCNVSSNAVGTEVSATNQNFYSNPIILETDSKGNLVESYVIPWNFHLNTIYAPYVQPLFIQVNYAGDISVLLGDNIQNQSLLSSTEKAKKATETSWCGGIRVGSVAILHNTSYIIALDFVRMDSSGCLYNLYYVT